MGGSPQPFDGLYESKSSAGEIPSKRPAVNRGWLGSKGHYRNLMDADQVGSFHAEILKGSLIGYTVIYGRISIIVPIGANLLISSISSSVTAIHPFVQSTPV